MISLVVEYYVYRYGGQLVGHIYGAGFEQIWLDDVRCSGTETVVTDCPHNDWGSHDCTHNEDISVSCIPGIIVIIIIITHTLSYAC